MSIIPPSPTQTRSGSNQGIRRKNPRIGKDAIIHKRPLQRPTITPSLASRQDVKVLYLSAKTPLMSAVRRIEKLLAQSEKRAVQSATALARAAPKHQRQAQDEILQIAENLNNIDSSESVVAKGSGKAIQKAMEVGLWFQSKPQYTVKITTTSTKVIDDIHNDSKADDILPDAEAEAISVFDLDQVELGAETHHTRSRQLSVLEVHIKLR